MFHVKHFSFFSALHHPQYFHRKRLFHVKHSIVFIIVSRETFRPLCFTGNILLCYPLFHMKHFGFDKNIYGNI